MKPMRIALDDDQLRTLERLAAEQDSTVPDLVRQAVDQYLAGRAIDAQEWLKQLDTLRARVRSRRAADVSPGEIEADITAARAAVRQERRASRGR